MALVIAALCIPAIAQSYGLAGSGNVDVLGNGIFETDGTAFRFPAAQDTNIDSLSIGDDKALALGNIWQKHRLSTATNNLDIVKNQDSGSCNCCDRTIDNVSPCKDCCTKVNIEQINIGNRDAISSGSASATNYIKVVTNQQ